jgi:cell division protein FtsA
VRSYTNEELIFGLDIGTRTVVGVVGYKENNKMVIVAYESIEHEERAMLDGQIHDIQKVSRAVLKVKATLEKRLGTELKDVAIAAAGRALNTQIVSVDSNYEEVQEFTLADIHNLELFGVEKAKDEQQKANSKTDYFCVAYSVIHYYLDGYIITNLEGHKGTSIGAKIIATFLPKLVIDSLYAVTERAGLTVTHLTLEPIAAINAVIPDNLRLLNLALVDIGAGTSDIAITKGGSVIAYGMIPIAGDEVTEAIVHKYLVDFNTAEKIKQQLTTLDTITFEDILGLTHAVAKEEVKQVILSTLESLTESIAHKILELNGENAPNAVFCVGGGSQMLSVTESLARLLELPEQRVAVRTAQNVVNVIDNIGILNGPEMITPLGICITNMQNKYSQFTTITLNGNNVQLLNAKRLTILDAIVALGIEHTDIFPKRGKTLMFKLNDERIRIKGENGVPASILLNGEPANISDLLKEQDVVQVEMASQGKDANAVISQYIKESFEVYLDGNKIIVPIIMVNNDCVSLDYSIKENDDIKLTYPKSIRELLDAFFIDYQNKMIMVNYNQVSLDYELQNQDSILINDLCDGTEEQPIKQGDGTAVSVNKLLTIDADLSNHHTFNTEDTVFELDEAKISIQDKLFITVNKEVVTLPFKDTPYMLASIFDYIAFDLTKPQGTIQLIRNGEPAALTDNLQDKDTLEIYWKK